MELSSIENIIQWIKNNTPSEFGLLVPVSGGSDSALCFWLCNQALPGRVLGIYSGTDLREKNWFTMLGEVKFLEPTSSSNPEASRWAQFLDYSISNNRILVGTRNRTEDVLGTYSLASRIAILFPIIGLWKTEILALGNDAGIPEAILSSSLRADPECGRPQELAEISISTIDDFLKEKEGLIDASNIKVSEREYLEKIYRYNRFKKDLPLRGPKIETALKNLSKSV